MMKHSDGDLLLFILVSIVVGFISGTVIESITGTTSFEKKLKLIGTEKHVCYANQTCNDGLSCASDLCVNITYGNP